MGRCGGKAAACERCCVPKPVRHFPGERARVTRKGRRAESRLARRLSLGTRRAGVASEQRDQERIAVQVGGVNPARLRAGRLEDAVPALAEFIDTVRRNGFTAIARRPQHEGRYFTTPTWREWRAYRRRGGCCDPGGDLFVRWRARNARPTFYFHEPRRRNRARVPRASYRSGSA